MPTFTTNFSFYKPAEGDGQDNAQQWAEGMNGNLDEIDALLKSHADDLASHAATLAAHSAAIDDVWVGRSWAFKPLAALPVGRGESGYVMPALADGRLVMVGGQGPLTTNVNDSIYLYSIPGNEWTVSPVSLPAVRAGAGVTRLADGRIVIAGGHTGAAYVATTYVLAANGASIAVAGNMGAARGFGAHALLTTGPHAGKIIALAGYNGARLTSTEIFDPATLTWAAGPTVVPYTFFNHCWGVFGDGRIALVGGYDNGVVVWVYNPVSNTWAQGENHPHGVRNGRLVTLPDGDLLLIGATSDLTVRLCYVLSAADLTWNRFLGMSPAPLMGAAISDVIDGQIYIAGGLYASGGQPRRFVLSITL